jgi:hypothetical protein
VFRIVYPVYSGFDGTCPTSATLLDVNGTWVVVPMLLPVLVALIPGRAPAPWRADRGGGVLGAFVVVAGFSIGLFYATATVAMVVAARARGGR